MKKIAQRISMIIAGLIVLVLLLLIARAIFVLTSVSSFKKAWAAESNAQINDDAIVISALGDSTVQGVGGFSKNDGFVGQVANRISKRSGKTVQIFNYSVSGSDSEQVLQTQVAQFKKLKRVDAVIVAMGPNDITHKKSLESFLENYRTLLSELPTEKTVIASLPPMGPKDTKGRSSYEWGQALKPVAAQNNVAVAPVFDKVNPRANDFRTYGGDFYHPSKAGYKLWADAFEPPLLKILNQ